jgi:PRTRC genetic system protein E
MNTNFFQTLDSLKVEGDWRIAVKKTGVEQYVVSVLLVNEKIGDDARTIIPPMILKGTAKEIDDGFYQAIEKPVQKTHGLFLNMEQYAKAQEQADLEKREQREKEREEKNKEKEKQKAEEEAGKKVNKKYDAQMKKAADLEAAGKCGQAIAQLPKESEFPEYAEEIQKRLQELKEKAGLIL